MRVVFYLVLLAAAAMLILAFLAYEAGKQGRFVRDLSIALLLVGGAIFVAVNT